jgi:dTDP-4-amino-4,6-dideoxygalactose transaminase
VIKRSVVKAGDEELAAVKRVLDSGRYILGEENKALEAEFASYCGSKYCVAVNSGTSALLMALVAAGVRGKEVITVPNSFVATANAIIWAGAKPVFVDVEGDTFNMDPDLLADAVTDDTAAIVPVDLYGHPCDFDRIRKVAGEWGGIPVIEDACQAHGAEYHHHRVGGISDITCFSLFPTKNLQAFGDGGLITTDDSEIYEELLMLRSQGRKAKDDCAVVSLNFRLSEIHAALAREQLKKLPDFMRARRLHANWYDLSLEGENVGLPVEAHYAKHAYHLYTILSDHRDELKAHLAAQGVETSVNYPIPIHRQTAYSEDYKTTSCPVAEKLAGEILSLPMYPGLKDEEIDFVCDAIRRFTVK